MALNNNSKGCHGCSKTELEVLYDISKVLSTFSEHQHSVFKDILSILESNLPMRHATIMLLLPDNQEIIVKESGIEKANSQQAKYYRGEGIIGRVVETGNPIVIENIDKEPLFKNRIYNRSKSLKENVGFVCVPVAIETEVVGTISLDITNVSKDLLTQSKRVLSIVASMIATFLKMERALIDERRYLEEENRRLLTELDESVHMKNIVCVSSVMKTVLQKVKILANADTTVLVRGPSGTGKELIASAIHFNSERKHKPLVKLNCAALSENLIESELFGHEKGAFSGAQFLRKGRIEEAQGGTLFLDEIGDFSPAVQVKLLRVIQEREFERVGSNKTLKADVRLITATNRDLESAVEDGSFREDLFYRINVFPVFLPPLNMRKEDILPLTNFFVKKMGDKLNKKIVRLSTPAIDALMSYHWPGNIRELENTIEYAVLLSTDGVIYEHNFPSTLQMSDSKSITASGTLRTRTESLERDMISDALKRAKGNATSAARELGITPRMIRYKMKQYRL